MTFTVTERIPPQPATDWPSVERVAQSVAAAVRAGLVAGRYVVRDGLVVLADEGIITVAPQVVGKETYA